MPTATVPCTFCGALNRVDLARIAQRPKCGHCSRLLLLDRPIKLSDDNFDGIVFAAEIPLVVDFYAEWCGPCQEMGPVLDEFAHERLGEMLVAKLDTDRNPNAAARFDIRGVPTVIVFENGRVKRRHTGAIGRMQLEQLLA